MKVELIIPIEGQKMRVLGTCTRARKAVILQRQTTLLILYRTI